MAKYLWTVTYTPDGARGLMKDGGIPDTASVAAICLAVNASGAATLRTTVLLTPEDLDKASEKTFAYTPPGR